MTTPFVDPNADNSSIEEPEEYNDNNISYSNINSANSNSSTIRTNGNNIIKIIRHGNELITKIECVNGKVNIVQTSNNNFVIRLEGVINQTKIVRNGNEETINIHYKRNHAIIQRNINDGKKANIDLNRIINKCFNIKNQLNVSDGNFGPKLKEKIENIQREIMNILNTNEFDGKVEYNRFESVNNSVFGCIFPNDSHYESRDDRDSSNICISGVATLICVFLLYVFYYYLIIKII